MGNFSGRNWKIYLDQETRERVEEILDHLERNYDGPSDFVQQQIMQEKALSLEKRIQKKESELEKTKTDLEKLKTIQEEREQQSKLRDKKELLKQKQEKLKQIKDRDCLSKDEIRSQVKEEIKEKAESSGKIDNVNEYIEKESVKNRIERYTETRFNKQDADVEALVEEVKRLQQEIKDLKGDNKPEIDFLELDVNN